MSVISTNRRYTLAALLLVATATTGAQADEPAAAPAGQAVGLRDILRQAVKGNPELAGKTVDVAIADAQIRETYGLDDWLLDAGVTWDASRTDPVSGAPFQITANDSIAGSASLTKPLPYGGQVCMS
jgi:hypothetical protein